MNSYGQKFAKLRIAQKLTLIQTCQGITSKSALSRWENGTGKMDIDKVILLLDRLGITRSEFFTLPYDEIIQKGGHSIRQK